MARSPLGPILVAVATLAAGSASAQGYPGYPGYTPPGTTKRAAEPPKYPRPPAEPAFPKPPAAPKLGGGAFNPQAAQPADVHHNSFQPHKKRNTGFSDPDGH